MTPAERVASDVWRRLGRAAGLGARLGEETLTDILVLDMLPHRRTNAFAIHHPTKTQESRSGADVLIVVRYPGGAGRRLALQAKKLYRTGRYGALAHEDVSGTRQIDKLDRFARQWGAVPAYLLYNHVDPRPSWPHWHCCRAYDCAQLGCTLVPSWCIRDAIRFRGRRTFRAVHADETARPWRCVFDCDTAIEQVDALSLLRPELRVAHGRVVVERRRPDRLRTDSDGFDALLEVEGALPATDLRDLLSGVEQASDEGHAEPAYPRRVLVVDVGVSGEEPERGQAGERAPG